MSEGRILLVDSPEGLRRRAFGGALVDLRTNRPVSFEMRTTLEALPFVRPPITQINARELRMIVEDAGTAIPPLMEWARAQNLEIESIGEYQPPFDDVFVKLVKQEDGGSNA